MSHRMWTQLFCVCLLINFGTSSDPIFPSVINGTRGAEKHAVILFVEGHRPGYGRLGGGTIISERHVLTAASVIHGAKHILIGYGGTDINDHRIKKTEMFTIHSNYHHITGRNDIAIVFVPRRIQFVFDHTVGKINLPHPSIRGPDIGIVGTLAGYGLTGADGHGASDVLLLAKLRVIHNLRCDLQFLVPMTTHFCAEPHGWHSNVCAGDHGAGLFGVPLIDPQPTKPPTLPPTNPPTNPPPTDPPPTDPPTNPPPTDPPPTDPPTKPPTEPTILPPTTPSKPPTTPPCIPCELRTESSINGTACKPCEDPKAEPHEVIIGIASLIVSRCNTRHPSAYTNVAHFYNWIMKVTDDLS